MNKNIIIAIVVLLFAALILAIGLNLGKSKKLKVERAAAELMAAEKKETGKKLASLENELGEMKKKSEENARSFETCNQKIADYEKKIGALAGSNRQLRVAEKELAELKKSKVMLESELASLRGDKESLSSQIEELTNKIKSQEIDKKKISDKLDEALRYDTDDFLVTATRGKKTERIVVCASRTKKLTVSFNVPQNLTDAISFSIKTPSGSVINPDDKTLSWYLQADPTELIASLSSVTGDFEQSKKIVLSYTPRERLQKGEYRIEINSNGTNIGNCRIMLK